MKSEEQIRKLLNEIQIEASMLDDNNSTTTMQAVYLYLGEILKNILDEPYESVYCCSICNIAHIKEECPLCHNSNIIITTADLICGE